MEQTTTNQAPNACQQISELVNSQEFGKNYREAYAGKKIAGVRFRKNLGNLIRLTKAAKEETIKIRDSQN